MRVRSIEMTITLEDGGEVKGYLSPESDQRWGNDLPHLGAAVEPMAAMGAALQDEGLWADDEDEEEDD